MRVPIRKRLAPGRTQKSLQIPIMRCSAVASLLAYFFSRRQARSRFYRALLAGISNKENKGQSLLSTVRNVFLKTDRSCRRIDHRCCCGESVSIISSDPSLPSVQVWTVVEGFRIGSEFRQTRCAANNFRDHEVLFRWFQVLWSVAHLLDLRC